MHRVHTAVKYSAAPLCAFSTVVPFSVIRQLLQGFNKTSTLTGILTAVLGRMFR